MKQFIVLTSITGEEIAIRASSIIFIEERKGKKGKIVVESETDSWNVSANHHSISSILKEIETIPINT